MVLIRDMPLIQRQICTQLYVVGTADSVVVKRSVPYSECLL